MGNIFIHDQGAQSDSLFSLLSRLCWYFLVFTSEVHRSNCKEILSSFPLASNIPHSWTSFVYHFWIAVEWEEFGGFMFTWKGHLTRVAGYGWVWFVLKLNNTLYCSLCAFGKSTTMQATDCNCNVPVATFRMCAALVLETRGGVVMYVGGNRSPRRKPTLSERVAHSITWGMGLTGNRTHDLRGDRH
jgi:hypothetical protein